MADHYCTLQDVNALVPQLPFTATSRPDARFVQQTIDDTANDMDAELSSLGFTVPVVAGVMALQWLRRTCAFGTLAIAQDVRGTAVNTAIAASGKEVENIWSQRYRARMKALRDTQDPTKLLDAPTTGHDVLKQTDSVLRSSVTGVSDDIWSDPLVTRNQVL